MSGDGRAARVDLKIEDGLAIISLVRPKAGNALDDQSGRELNQAALESAMSSQVRAVLLRADGPNFCFGGDLGHVANQKDPARALREMTQDFHNAILTLTRMNAPLVCAIRGAAAGAGLSLAAASDYVVASETALFAYAYTGVGFSADGGLTWTLPRLIGLRNFQTMYLTNRRVAAQEALDLGIVSEVVIDSEMDARAHALALELSQGPTLAFGAVKRLAADSFNSAFPAQLQVESERLAELVQSADAKGAIDALLNRRSPAFRGV